MAAQTANPIRSVLLASPDQAWRERLRTSLISLRWQVREARGGADAIAQLEEQRPEVLLIDHYLPDLEVAAFTRQISAMYPDVDLFRADGEAVPGSIRSPRRHELLHALREAVDAHTSAVLPDATDTALWASAPESIPEPRARTLSSHSYSSSTFAPAELPSCVLPDLPSVLAFQPAHHPPAAVLSATPAPAIPIAIPGLVGSSPPIHELITLIRLVAPRTASVLLEGETGTGKEVVAKAIHQLSKRAGKPMTTLNCAAIPEALLEAELFGHTRGAFTGAVQSRVGRIEAANGGTLFLDEIGEMPLALQSKLLRFLDCGELQRVGDNEILHVDVRVIAATHQHLEKNAAEGRFRLDLFHRLAVFPLAIPPLRDRKQDIPELAEHFLARMGKDSPRKRLSPAALSKLTQGSFPGNVRELAHILERATILAGETPLLGPEHIRFTSSR